MIADDIWKVVSTTFIDTEDEVVVKNWEDITQLSGEGLTIFQRKVNVLFTLTEKNYVPMNITVTLNKSFSNTCYTVVASKYKTTANSPASYPINLGPKTSSSFIVGTGGDNGSNFYIQWYACGY